MMVGLTDARTITTLAPQIDEAQGQIDALATAIANNAIIIGGSIIIRNDIAGETTERPIRVLTAAESHIIMLGMKAMLAARLAALTASLTAL